ncbi:hypothetical protein B0H19DRAFT_1185295 [Mycena capillaripes]|nr:hypothetical protein B0H19DRAFT_1185295 [Mycena capillaripes]
MTVLTRLTLDDATLAYDHALDHYFYSTSVVLLIYDHLLTFRSEVRYIWTTDHTRALAWYLLVRYFALFANVAMFALYFGDFSAKVSPSYELEKWCITLNTVQNVLLALQELMIGITLALRVLAMYSFDKRVMFTLASAAIIVICLFIRTAVGSEPPQVYRTNLPGCYSVSSNARYLSPGVAGAWEALLAADLLCLGLTLYRGYARIHDGAVLPNGSLWQVLVCDGDIVCLANGANILMYYISDGLGLFTLAVSVTVVCRLMLNLHEAASKTSDSAFAGPGSIQFAPRTSWQHESGRSDTMP